MNKTHNLVLYGTNLFGNQHPAMTGQQLDSIKHSGFGTLVLWALHVEKNGELSYRGNRLVAEGRLSNQQQPLRQAISDLKENGSISKVLFSLGGSASSDCANLKKLLASRSGIKTLSDNFSALFESTAIDGIELTLEEFPLSDYQDTIVDLTLLLHRNHGAYLSYSPYSLPKFWLDCLQRIYRQNQGKQVVSHFSLRCYAGGEDNNPGLWAKQIDASTGIDNPGEFIVPVYWCRHGIRGDQGLNPGAIRDRFAALTLSHPGIRGGAIWNSDDIFMHEMQAPDPLHPQTVSAYAQAIVAGLNG